MKRKVFFIIMVSIVSLFFAASEGVCLEQALGGKPIIIQADPGPPAETAARVEETPDMFANDAQYPDANTPDAVPTVPAEIHNEERRDVSNNPNPVHENWYEGMEASGVDMY